MLRIESTDHLRVANKREGTNQPGDVSRRNRLSRSRFCSFQGDTYMKKVLCAADALVRSRASTVAALLCAASLSGPVLAAPAGNAPAENTGLEEIIVTAEKRESTVQATPISMTALSANDLLDQNITSVQDLVGTVPGLSARTAGPGQTEYEMRGLGSSGGSVATVGFYLDETPLSASAVALTGRTVIDAALYDLNRTE